MDILIAISGAQLITLLGMAGKIWSWSHKLEARLSVLETHVMTLLKRDEARMWYLQGLNREVKKDV
ncbi:MAG TPA: hypothetical protein VI935_01175 [Thermodesulfobacteriota bacterium]|nr:hypothetical protein [Thermodesulfobacteriota bacterium]